MEDWSTLLSVMLGGAIALLGTILSNLLQHRIESRNLKRERLQERFNTLREYLFSCLRMASLTYHVPLSDEARIEIWQGWLRKEIESGRAVDVGADTWRFYTSDTQVLTWARELETIMNRLRSCLDVNQPRPLPFDREELDELQLRLVQVASGISQRLDELVDRV